MSMERCRQSGSPALCGPRRHARTAGLRFHSSLQRQQQQWCTAGQHLHSLAGRSMMIIIIIIIAVLLHVQVICQRQGDAVALQVQGRDEGCHRVAGLPLALHSASHVGSRRGKLSRWRLTRFPGQHQPPLLS